ncbi:MAG: FHIPEP family type III secretion protein [Deltaproteobacteria bacterium]|nr:FHIPEP family type III secretion protein [Deltaproteobacteria bacterium]
MLREMCIPAAILVILASLLLPLPAVLIDWLLIANLLFALILLASALYLSEPIKLSALPTMLLLATLYRLALNVSTTRLILNSGQAGRVIEAFGEVVIQGNLVVGIIVFLIITSIQFLVIAKGAERVAEVAARFALDAMPGKQMSIDADVRAGLIDFETARQRRQDLQTESRFYGALDGAMKFIKGDAIAGLLITAINSIGGLLVGVFLLELDLTHAVRQFTLLTVGDGVASQIPALLNALAAGIVVTRVTRGDGESLATELPKQLGQLRSVKIIVGVTALSLATIPHMPAIPFVGIALVFFVAAALGVNDSSITPQRPVLFQPRSPALLHIRMPEKLGREVYATGKLNESFDIFRQKVFEQTGLILHPPEFSLHSDSSNHYEVLIRGVAASRGSIDGDSSADFNTILRALEEVVLDRASELVDDILTRRTLDRFDKEAPELVSAVIPSVITVTQLSEILRELVREGITIRNFDLILQAVAEHGAKARNERALLEEARIALRRIICARFLSGTGKTPAYSLGPLIDMTLHECEREGRALELGVLDKFLDSVRRQDLTGSIVVASKSARRLLREVLAGRGIQTTVLAYDEIPKEFQLDYRGILEIEEGNKDALLEALAA